MKRIILFALIAICFAAFMPNAQTWAIGSFTGTVVDSATNEPVEDAVVIISRYSVNPEIVDTCFTDTLGTYLFDSLLTGRRYPYTLTVVTDSFALAVKSNLILSSNQIDTVDFYLVAPDTTAPPQSAYGVFLGNVTDSLTGQPLSGVRVVLNTRINAAWQAVDSMLTGADGLFRFDSIPASLTVRYAVSASIAGYVPESRNNLYADSGSVDTVNFLLIAMDTTNSWLLSGIVTSDSLNGRPLANALVEVVQKTGTEFHYSTTTDDAGGFEVLVVDAARTYSIIVTLTGYKTKTVSLAVAEDSTETAIFMVPETLITGVTIGVAANNGYRLSVTPNPANAGVTIAYGLPMGVSAQIALYGIDGRLVRLLSGNRTVQCGNSLRINITGIPAGAYIVKADAGDRQLIQRLIIQR